MNIHSSNSRIIAWSVWIVASLFYAYQYVLRVMPNIMFDEIMQKFHIGATTFGQFSGVYYIGYSLMHLPIGVMLDRYGPRKVMAGCMALSTIGLLPLILSDYWIYPVVGRCLIGMGSSAAILGVFKIIRMTFSEERFPRMLSISVTIGLIGAIYGGAPVSYMRDTFGYQTVVYMLIASGLFLALMTYWIVPASKSISTTSVFADVREVISNKQVVLTCIFAGFMVGPLEGFADVWGTTFLKQYGFDGTVAASLPSMIYIGMCFGSPVLNYIAEKVGSFVATIIAAGIIMMVSFSCMLMFQLSATALTSTFLLVGVCCAYQILAIYKASTYVREQVAGLTTAIANMIIMIFGYAFHATIGAIVDMMGGASAPKALSYGIATIPVALGIAALGFMYVLIQSRSQKTASS